MSDQNVEPAAAPITDLRSLTSAANGAKSHGPVTAEGKARSSRNGETHGMFANAVLLRHEPAEAFEEFRLRYYRDFSPVNQSQADLVDQMIAAVWRFRRLNALESAALDHAVDAQRAHVDATYEGLDAETRAHFAFDKLTTSSSTFTTYNRFQSSLMRIYDRALRNLRFLQDAEAKSKKSQSEPNFTDAETTK
jgi:hypothetical protein